MAVNLDTITEPTEADLLAVEDVTGEDVDWEALLPAPITVKEAEDFWHEDDNCHDDRYDGEGIPSWSVWA